MCSKNLGTASLQIQLECQIREHIHRYYEGWTVCDDPTCGNRARAMGVYGRRCLKDWCRGTVSFEVSLRYISGTSEVDSDDDLRLVFGRNALQPVAIFPTPLRYRESESI